MNNDFDRKLATKLGKSDLKNQQIKGKVLHYCVEAALLSREDIKSKSTPYVRIAELIDINILALNLLELTILDVSEVTRPVEVQTEIDSKAASIIKDIVKRLMNEQLFTHTEEKETTFYQFELDI